MLGTNIELDQNIRERSFSMRLEGSSSQLGTRFEGGRFWTRHQGGPKKLDVLPGEFCT